MKFNIKKFKNNILFFIISGLLLAIFILLGTIENKKNSNIDKKELSEKESSINSLVINEVMLSNKGTITAKDGKLYDYVELYNGSNKDIELKDYGLGDEENKIKWVFPKTTIKAKSYLLVFLSGANSSGLYASFKLKASGGETLSLFKPNGKVIDAVDTAHVDNGKVMSRDENGKWFEMDPTPGYANTTKGLEQFQKLLVSSEEKTVVINEILANNKGNFKNKNSEYSGYIEIKNISKKSVNLENYSLSNDENISFKWQLPKINLSSGEVLVVYTSGDSSKTGELNASFKLNNKNGYAILTNNKGQVIDKVKYENLGNGFAYIKEKDSFVKNNSISPGYDNTTDGIKKFQKEYLKNPSDLIINEVMNNNYKYLMQNGGNYYDWIELYNNSGKTLSLKDYCLTTNIDSSCMYNLPDVKLKKGEYYIVMASGNENLSNKSYKHANFKLSETESLFITKSDKIVDSMFIANIPNGYSMGRGSSYGINYYSKPTPKSKNGNGTIAVSSLPYASIASGMYDKTIKVALNGSNKIYYTLDGSEPTKYSKVYSSPLTIKKTTVLRIMSYDANKLRSEINTYSYIINDSHKIAVMSIAIDNSRLNKVNSNTSLNSPVIEPAYVQYFDPDGTGFEIGAGLKLFGGSTRSYRKKSYEIKFKKEFGAGSLEYKMFDTVDSSNFESLVLRTGSQDEFQYSKVALIRDIFATSLMDEYTNVDVQAYKPVVLYLNGEYWGIYFIREKVDENFVANHYNVNATNKNTNIIRIDGEVKTGSSNSYNSMLSYISSHPLSDKNNYKKIKEQIDIENLCDFWIGEIWGANYDIVNTRFFSNPDVDNGKWKFIFYDLDSAYYNVSNDYYTYYTNSAGIGYGDFSTFLLRNLMKSSEFRKTFLERLSYNLKNTWSYKNVNNKIDSVIKEIGKDEIKRNLQRWGVCSYNDWKSNIDYIKDFAKNRNKYMVNQAKSYFGLSDSEVKKYFGDVK